MSRGAKQSVTGEFRPDGGGMQSTETERGQEWVECDGVKVGFESPGGGG